MQAAFVENVQVAKILLMHRADLRASDNDGATALTWAVRRHHEDVANVLHAAGATS